MKNNSRNVRRRTCPKCQTKNQNSSRFCKQCGSSLAASSLKDKRARVLAGKEKKSFRVSIPFALMFMFVGVFGYWLFKSKPAANPAMSYQPRVSGNQSYSGQATGMTDIEARVEDGKISIPVDVVLEKKIVRFVYEEKGSQLPLLAYVTPSGKAVTAVSMCEPCRSTRFHIREKIMVCNSCYTEWNLETLRGIRGGCLNYPPDLIPSTMENGRIWIDEETVIRWRPRA